MGAASMTLWNQRRTSQQAEPPGGISIPRIFAAVPILSNPLGSPAAWILNSVKDRASMPTGCFQFQELRETAGTMADRQQSDSSRRRRQRLLHRQRDDLHRNCPSSGTWGEIVRTSRLAVF